MAKRKSKKNNSKSKQNNSGKRRSLNRSAPAISQEKITVKNEVPVQQVDTKNISASVISETKPQKKKLSTYRLIRRIATCIMLLIVLSFIAAYFLFTYELQSANLQSHWLHKIAKRSNYRIEAGESHRIRFPDSAPYDLRAGYSIIPNVTEVLKKNDFSITRQAVVSLRHSRLIDLGLFPLYQEKDQFGLKIYDLKDERLYRYSTPERVFTSFSKIPPIIINTLLFIEDRHLLNNLYQTYNPAVEWDRFARALMDVVVKVFNKDHHVQGGSTLATQIEKYRHSKSGRTSSLIDKLRQMASASLRAYQSGKNTVSARQAIARSYINTVPLAAVNGYGEVHGLGDGLWAYYGQDLDQVIKLLGQEIGEEGSELLKQQAMAYRQVLGLFIAHRRPSEFLGSDLKILQDKLQIYLEILHKHEVIPERLFKSTSAVRTEHRRQVKNKTNTDQFDKKAADKIRNDLMKVTGLNAFYDLDRLDLSIKTTLNAKAQVAASKIIQNLQDKTFASKRGLLAYNLLNPNLDLSKIIYSFTVYEKGERANYLRVQTDSSPQPFNLNEGGRLDLGSTAKVRTLISYLEILQDLYTKFHQQSTEVLKAEREKAQDPISIWFFEYLLKYPKISEIELLKVGMERKYSANPGTRFFTAGGMHTFNNFNRAHNGGVYSLNDSIRHSINLPFIRLMQDVMRFYSVQASGVLPNESEKLSMEMQSQFLDRFIQQEGRQFLQNFYKRYKGKSKPEIIKSYLSGNRKTLEKAGVLFWLTNPSASMQDFEQFLAENKINTISSEKRLKQVWEYMQSNIFPIQDKAYIGRVHLLDAYVCARIFQDPEVSLTSIFTDSIEIIKSDYTWLLKSKSEKKRYKRINVVLEQNAFALLHKRWVNLGYSMSSLVPSLATALGTSADKPASLATLMGIILNDGKLLPTETLSELNFAEHTPFYTEFKNKTRDSKQVLASSIAEVVRDALYDVSANGTAIRLKKGLKISDKKFLKVAGKTGTGDHRFKEYSRSGAMVNSRVVNRTATFMFIVDDRFFGTISAFVPGEQAKNYKFTSSLPVALLGTMEEVFAPLVEQK